ncbi:hypothetical protein EJ04DRAFT_525582 [Polyplosphaeria fusca]|uniref:JmjC domain-containing protein n=1 Tax=Polyplosphaeria fusca TaxID=682080 RepID=A0A9P4QV50_9PLEO|nr:hypothetical protein EJ04DRAFT_525582 [Polyplosphaeria fusca]
MTTKKRPLSFPHECLPAASVKKIIDILRKGDLKALQPGGKIPKFVREAFGPDVVHCPHIIPAHVAFDPTPSNKGIATHLIAGLLKPHVGVIVQHNGRIGREDTSEEKAKLLLDAADENDESSDVEGWGIWNLHHDSSYVSSYIASGAKLWVIYPPTAENLEVLCETYRTEYPHDTLGIFEVYQRLKNGIAVLQPPGTHLWQPPLCPHSVFTLSSSVLVGGEIYRATDFAFRLQNIEIEAAWAVRSRTNCDQLVLELRNHLYQALCTRNNEFAMEERSFQREILDSWDQVIGEPHLETLIRTAKTIKMKHFKDVWVNKLLEWGVCPCGEMIKNAGRPTTSARLRASRDRKAAVEHFNEQHMG